MATRTFLTTCPDCKTLQLFDAQLFQRRVKCANCGAEFPCKKSAGPIPWVQDTSSDIPAGGFRKIISRVLFSYGIAIPPANQESFILHMGKTMQKGAVLNTVVHFRAGRFPATLNFFVNKRGEPTLHLCWTNGSPITMALQNALPDEYHHYVISQDPSFLPDRYVYLKPDSRVGEFELIVPESANHRTMVSTPALSETLKDSETQQTLHALLT